MLFSTGWCREGHSATKSLHQLPPSPSWKYILPLHSSSLPAISFSSLITTQWDVGGDLVRLKRMHSSGINEDRKSIQGGYCRYWLTQVHVEGWPLNCVREMWQLMPTITWSGVNVRFLGRPPLLSTRLETGRRRGNSYCRRATAELECRDELLASLLTDSVSMSVLPSIGDTST